MSTAIVFHPESKDSVFVNCISYETESLQGSRGMASRQRMVNCPVALSKFSGAVIVGLNGRNSMPPAPQNAEKSETPENPEKPERPEREENPE
jgi:hypothetical protein